MVTRRRERRPRKRPRGDPILLEERAVQRPLDDQRPLRRFGELYDPIRIRRLRGRERQSPSKADEVVRVLRDVMLEARVAQRAGRELRVEGHRADGLVDGGVFVPGLAREEPRSAHGMGFLKPNGARPDVSKTWWWMQPESNLSSPSNSLLAGNLAGNFLKKGRRGRFSSLKRVQHQLLIIKFPAQRSRELFCRSHRLLKFEHELVHRLAARRLDRKVARILGVAPEIACGDELESGRLDFAA